MSQQPFVRQLENQPGIQLNPLADTTGYQPDGTADQFMAMALVLPRGRTDKAFLVNRNNAAEMTGNPADTKDPTLRQAHIQMLEALDKGALGCVVSRLHKQGREPSWIVCDASPVGSGAVFEVRRLLENPDGSWPDVESGASSISETGPGIQSVAVAKGEGGFGYAPGNIVRITQPGTGAQLFAVVTKVGGDGSIMPDGVMLQDKDKVLGADGAVLCYGSGFWRQDGITAEVVAGSGAQFNVTVNKGKVSGITVAKGGQGYMVGQSVVVQSRYGNGARGKVVAVTNSGAISNVNVVDGGSGYVDTGVPDYDEQINAIVSDIGFYLASEDSLTRQPRTTVPGDYLFAIKHLACHDDGIRVAVHADAAKTAQGKPAASRMITVALTDSKGVALSGMRFTGSTDPDAKDSFGNSIYLPDVAKSKTGLAELVCGEAGGLPQGIRVASDAYGGSNGVDKWASSWIMRYYVPGAPDFEASDYTLAVNALENTTLAFGYIASGGTESVALLRELSRLAYAINTQLRYDIPGRFGVEEAISFAEMVGFKATDAKRLCHGFWAPIKSDAPAGGGAKGYYGVSGWHIAKSCARNAIKDSNGIAAKRVPIAGAAYPLDRTGMEQICFPTEHEKSLLADACINPVLNEQYAGASLFVITDLLTSDPMEEASRQIPVVEMATSVDRHVAQLVKRYLPAPFENIKFLIARDLSLYFDRLITAGWLIEPDQYWYEIKMNPDRPNDSCIANYLLHYSSCIRQVYISQTII